MSTIAASDVALAATPTRVSQRCPVALPRATSAGPAMTGHHSGGLLVIRSTTSGRCSASHSWATCWKTTPEGAASWWASTHRVRVASAGPSCATTLYAVRGRITVRRPTSQRPLMSSTMPAAASAPPTTPIRRWPLRPWWPRRWPRSAASPAPAASADSMPIGQAYELRAGTSSMPARAPSPASRSRISSAAARSPGEVGSRGIGASCSTTERSSSSSS